MGRGGTFANGVRRLFNRCSSLSSSSPSEEEVITEEEKEEHREEIRVVFDSDISCLKLIRVPTRVDFVPIPMDPHKKVIPFWMLVPFYLMG